MVADIVLCWYIYRQLPISFLLMDCDFLMLQFHVIAVHVNCITAICSALAVYDYFKDLELGKKEWKTFV